ncbi:MAG: hypothetical protein A2X12_01545 [Bacteroidetes bacterium GWE2_29_8]|nr:MAG: hypothetical protein A2X12_01545 [Bacteroidetes bacterium GWE2_29_8]OFY19949.1 MAG: hypothetical protein A2X02_05370 [Bacteroidetes bacterium GWF2_29_10]
MRLLTILMLCPFASMHSQSINGGIISKSIVYANYYHQILYNPSLTSSAKQKNISLFNENRYLIKELQSNGLTFLLPLKTNNYWSFGFCQKGNIHFGRYYIVISLAKKLQENLSVASSFNYTIQKQGEDYNSINHFDGNISLSYKVGNLSLATSIHNIYSFFQDDLFVYPAIYFATGYKMNNYLKYFVEFDKFGFNGLIISGGISVSPNDKITINLGSSGKNNIISIGVGGNYRSYEFEIDCSYHIMLGLTPSLCFAKNF